MQSIISKLCIIIETYKVYKEKYDEMQCGCACACLV